MIIYIYTDKTTQLGVSQSGTVHISCPLCETWTKAAQMTWHIRWHHSEEWKSMRARAVKAAGKVKNET